MAESSTTARTAGSGKKYVRTFLFSTRLDAPLHRLHVITKFTGILVLSFVLIRVMNERSPDPIMAGCLLLLSLLALYLGGASRWLFQSYMIMIFPMFLLMFLGWIALKPDPGTHTYLRWEVYSGKIGLGVSASGLILISTMIVHYFLTKKILRSIFLGIVLALAVSHFTPNPGITVGTYTFLRSYTFVLSDRNILIAGTKVLGYAAMVFMTLMLVMTTRDNELTAALRQFRMPYLARFFISLLFRSLSLALMDFQTIRQAQIARGIRMRRMSIFAELRNVALMSVPMVAMMLRRSSEIGDALQARGFSLSRAGREYLEVQPLGTLDMLVFLTLILVVLLVFGFSLNLYKVFLGVVP